MPIQSYRGKGPSKNYLTPIGGEGVDDFVTYSYVNFEGEGLFCEIVTQRQILKLRTQRALSNIFSALWNHQKEKYK